MVNPSASNGLALLAFKCAARVFDISSGLAQVSIRDQIVRAQLFVDDLHAKAPAPKLRLLVIGAGIAGVSAALRAKERGMEVVLVDAQGAPFSLQAHVTTRYVGPFMYEWPSHGWDAQSYPNGFYGRVAESTPRWSTRDPLPASELVRQLKAWLSTLPPHALPDAHFGVDASVIRDYVQRFVAFWGQVGLSVPELVLRDVEHDWLGHCSPKGLAFTPDYVVLAVGMGAERVEVPGHPLVKGQPFWSNDGFRTRVAFHGVAGVFGGGDGALQDVLRLLTRHDHPLHLIRAIERSSPAVREHLRGRHASLLALEQQARLLSMWAPDGAYALLDRECQAICRELAQVRRVRWAVLRQLRSGTGYVHHIWREQTFGKAYLLNRFVLHLIEQCVKAGRPGEQALLKRKVRYVPYRGREVTRSKGVPGKRWKVKVKLDKSGSWLALTHVAVRYGVKDLAFDQRMVTLSDEQTQDRMSMAGILLPPQLSKQPGS